LTFNFKRDTEIQKRLICWSRMLRNPCRLKKNKEKEANRKKKIKKNTLLHRRKKILGAVHGKH
jgi:hypothetical protein